MFINLFTIAIQRKLGGGPGGEEADEHEEGRAMLRRNCMIGWKKRRTKSKVMIDSRRRNGSRKCWIRPLLRGGSERGV